MSSRMTRTLLAAAAWGLMQSPLTAFAAPTYEQTVAFLEGASTRPFVEQGKCAFLYDNNYRFNAGDLNTVYKVVGLLVEVKCARGKRCVDPRATETLETSLRFYISNPASATRVTNARTYLIGMCGGTTVDPSMFDK